jgi:hypothetical protein
MSITIKATSQCAGGGHVTLTLTGDVTTSFEITADEIRDLEPMTEPERKEMLLRILKFHFRGKNLQQIRNELTSPSGVVITL